MYRLVIRSTAFLLAFAFGVSSISLVEVELYSTQNIKIEAPTYIAPEEFLEEKTIGCPMSHPFPKKVSRKTRRKK
ncbi:MAG TPA: hypothetical protein VF599_03985 [Pyrinomonadaceae bacterium]|jgi:hypothetical protein